MNVTLRFQSTGKVPGNAGPVAMRGPSLTIGRGPNNDLVLPDPTREVSTSHCVIENQGGNIVAIDLSTNGTFLNYGKIPLGRTPSPLNDGDVLTIGPYELVVGIDSGARGYEMLAPAGETGIGYGHAGRAPDPMALLDDAAPGGDFLDSLLGEGPKGPKNMRLAQPDADGLLPPLSDDDPLAPPPMPDAPAMRDHGASASDSFRPAAPSRSLIPDDWEEDLLAPPSAPAPRANPFGAAPFGASPPNPFAAPPPPAPPRPPAMLIPEDDDLLAPAAPVAPPAAPPMAEVAPPPVVELGASQLGSAAGPLEALAPAPEALPPLDPVPEAAPIPPAERPSTSPFAEGTKPPFVAAALPVEPVAETPEPTLVPARPEEDDLLASISQAPLVPDLPPAPPMPEPVAEPVAAPSAAAPLAPVAQPVSADQADLARGFLTAMGAGGLNISDADLGPTLTRLGTTLRVMISGLREILMTRSSIKQEFRIDQTMISAGGNNPLKFSVSEEVALETMARPSARGYLDSVAAARQALDDIKAHEVAMVTGMEAALKDLLTRLDPARLTTEIEAKGGGFGGFFKGKKALYWETYEKMYAEISDQAQNDFHALFAREFARAYKEQLARLKEQAKSG